MRKPHKGLLRPSHGFVSIVKNKTPGKSSSAFMYAPRGRCKQMLSIHRVYLRVETQIQVTKFQPHEQRYRVNRY